MDTVSFGRYIYGMFSFISDFQDVKYFFKEFSVYNLILYFFIYSFLGWLAETAVFFYKEKKFKNRGFLFLPILPVYGFGMCLIILFLIPAKKNIFLLFVGSFFVVTILEYFTGYVLERLFNIKWWDYTHKRFSVGGRIRLDISIDLAITALLIIVFAHPFIELFVLQLPKLLSQVFVIIFILGVIADLAISVLSVLQLNDKLEQMHYLRKQIYTHIGSVDLYESAHEMINSFSMWYDDFIRVSREKMDKIPFEHVIFTKEEFIDKFEKLNDKYDALRKSNTFTYKRIFSAFPDIKSNNFSKALSELEKYLR